VVAFAVTVTMLDELEVIVEDTASGELVIVVVADVMDGEVEATNVELEVGVTTEIVEPFETLVEELTVVDDVIEIVEVVDVVVVGFGGAIECTELTLLELDVNEVEEDVVVSRDEYFDVLARVE